MHNIWVRKELNASRLEEEEGQTVKVGRDLFLSRLLGTGKEYVERFGSEKQSHYRI